MYIVQISDRETFAERARKSDVPVNVVRTPTVVPVQQGTSAVVMQPALAIDYAMEFEDPDMGETKWTFREVVPTNERGEATLTGSLLADLQKCAPANVRIIHRSGSV